MTFRNPKPGDPFQPSVAEHAVFVEAAVDYLRRRRGGQVSDKESVAHGAIYRVRCGVESGFDRFDVCAVSSIDPETGETFEGRGVFPTAENNPIQFRAGPALIGRLPELAKHDEGRFGICLQPIAYGQIGPAIFAGVTIARVFVEDSTKEPARFADIKDGDKSQLEALDAGAAEVFWREEGTGTRWAVIRLGGAGGGGELIGGCLRDDHPGRGVVFEIYLGLWDAETHAWIYQEDLLRKAIDWRYAVPYPDAGSTGLFAARRSMQHGVIYETVALDCDTPGPCFPP